jgi:hypothetical protein
LRRSGQWSNVAKRRAERSEAGKIIS